MKNTLLDISQKIDPFLFDLYSKIDQAAQVADVQWLVIGATAREMVFDYAFEKDRYRATKDIDFAMYVDGWDNFDRLTECLVSTGAFLRTRNMQEFQFTGATQHISLDIVPFGGVENESGDISWPKHEMEMSAIGFREALETAVRCKICSQTGLTINVTHPATLILLKLLTWQHRRLTYKGLNDAGDAARVMTDYLDLGNEYRLDIEENGRYPLYEIDESIVGARLLGRDLAATISGRPLDNLKKLVELELEKGDESKLLADMIRSKSAKFHVPALYSELLAQLYLGLTEPEYGVDLREPSE